MAYIPPFATEITSESRNEIVDVESLNVFDDKRVGKTITLIGDVAYNITKKFPWEDVEFVLDPDARITFLTSNTVSSSITTSILPGRTLFSGALNRISFEGIDITSENGGDCFNFTKGNTLIPFMGLDRFVVGGFDRVGTVDNLTLIMNNIGYGGNSNGWKLLNCPLLSISEQNLVFNDGISFEFSGTTGSIFFTTIIADPTPANITFDLSGTLVSALFNSLVVNPLSGKSVFNIDPSIVITGAFQIIGGSIDTSSGGTMFKAGSLDQTDPKIIVDNVFGTPSSYVVGFMVMTGNSTVTTINDVGVYEDIAGTITAGPANERFTFSTDTLTYTGREDIKVAIDISIFLQRDIAAASRVLKFGMFLNNVVDQEAEVTMSSDITNSSFTTGIRLVTGDTLKMKVQNTQDTADVIITTFDFRVIEA